MKSFVGSFLLLIVSLVFCGCPYESHVPIDRPSIPVQEQLLGTWVTDAESYNQYFIAKENSLQYSVLQKAITGNTSKYLAHLSEVKGATFLNLYSDSTKTYYLYRVKMDPNGAKLTLMPFSEKLDEKFSSSSALKSYVEKHMNFQSFYNNEDVEDFMKVQ